MSPRSTFEKNEKGQLLKISYIDYYKKNYGIDIMDWDQPMLISRYVFILVMLYEQFWVYAYLSARNVIAIEKSK